MKGSDMKELRYCAICGNAFVAKARNGKYCGKECSEEGNRRLVRKRCAMYRAQAKGVVIEKVEEKPTKAKELSLVEVAIEARKAGMTYGQYVAHMSRKK